MSDRLVGGLDECGWGSLAGPIISCVAVFRESALNSLPAQVTDSKKISAAVRESMFLVIQSTAVDIGVGWSPSEEVDSLGANAALQLSYTRALDDLKYKPEHLIVDGSNSISSWKGSQQVEPKADLRHKPVSAASIYGKVFHDRIMVEYAKQFPVYGWEKNKGYGTRVHEAAILKHGLSKLHRKIYCRRLLLEMS